MPNLTASDLSDPQPPAPGERERSLVAARARQLGRRRRLLQGAGALGVVAAVSVSVAALTAGGSSGPTGTNRVEAASATTDAVATTSPTPTVPPTVATTVPVPPPTPDPAPTADTAPPAPTAAAAPVAPAAPTTFTLTGTVTGNPANTTVTVTLQGVGGSFTATADGAGNFSISGLPAGDYTAVGQWVDSTGTATGAKRFGTVTVSGDSSVSFSFP